MNLNKYILKPYNYSSYKDRGWFGRKLYLLGKNLSPPVVETPIVETPSEEIISE